VSGLFAIGVADSEQAFIFLAYYPAAAFWVLDAYFLRQERLFRRLYDHVRVLNEDEIDFSMNTNCVQSGCESWVRTMFAHTLKIFYGIVLASITAVFITTIVK